MAHRYLSRWEPFRDLVNIRTDMDRLFNAFFGTYPDETDSFWSPMVDIEESNGNLVVKAELPGMKKDDIKVSVHDNVLSVSGERRQEKETKEKTFHRVERYYGKFMRSIALPKEVNADTIKATYKDGVLNITLQKPESMKPKDIDVKVE